MSHVALLIPGLDRIGGAEQQVILLAKGLVKRGWQVSVVALSGSGGEAAAELTAAGVQFLGLRMLKGLADPRGWMRFHGWLREQSPEVIHAHLPHAVWLARWSRLGAPVRVLVDTQHSSSTGTWGRRLGYRASDWLPDAVTAVSRAVAEAHVAAAMVDASKLSVLPNGIDVQVWRPDAARRAATRRELGIGDGFLWFAAGRLEPVKNYPTLLAALAQLPDSASLAIAGAGWLLDELQQLSAKLGVQERVRFLGFEPDVMRWMQAADGFVLSSCWEGPPMGLLEAAACALPSVATDVPGTREVIVAGQTGWLVPAANASALQTAMIAVMQISPAERYAIGERARQRVVAEFNLDAVLDRWEAFYTGLLQKNPTPRRYHDPDY